MNNILVIGNGGREHAIVWKLSKSEQVGNIFVACSNAGISKVNKVKNISSLDLNDVKAVSDWCLVQNIHLVVVGPEAPLTTGISDVLKSNGIPCFGPIKDAAKIESDKSWAKNVMDKFGVPTASWMSFHERNEAVDFIKGSRSDNSFKNGFVIKASGLAAGKGVYVTSTEKDAIKAVDIILTEKKFGSSGDKIVIEEKLEGIEVSVLCFTDGETIKIMLPAQDHKRLLDNDEGGMTGGMGAYCPCPIITEEQLRFVHDEILLKTVKGLSSMGIRFVGVLYAGLMLTDEGDVKVLEFNCRFGDPEAEVIIPLLETDLYTIMKACCSGTLDKLNIKWKDGKSAVGVVMASKGYPDSSSKGDLIEGVDEMNGVNDMVVFHCGTKSSDIPGCYLTDGGRVLVPVAVSDTLLDAAIKATSVCKNLIKFDGAQYRMDIAHKGLTSSILNTGRMTYKSSGVDIIAGDSLVGKIKDVAHSTAVDTPGTCGDIGGFGAVFDIKGLGYSDPLIVSSTDGVGTKLKIAQECNNHKTIGIDLVAMCVNDLLAQGATPLFFLDYYATSKLDQNVAATVISGIADGCKLTGCALVGGETAEMPGMYSEGDYDLAGFSVGIVERSGTLPRIDDIKVGDVVIGLPSSGVHSNGFSLVRRIIEDNCLSYNSVAPFSDNGLTLGEELLKPTAIYVQSVLPLIKDGSINAVAHITGGGLLENIPRVIPKQLKVVLNANEWKIPKVFAWLSSVGNVSRYEMLRTFNCGVGLVLIVKKENKEMVLKSLVSCGASTIGTVQKRCVDKGDHQVEVLNFYESLSPIMLPYVKALSLQLEGRKRVAVLISGSGTNLQALIDSTVCSPHAEIVLVISNKENAYGLKRAEKANIASKVIKHDLYATREKFEKEIDKVLNYYRVDIICLAGFMRILTGWFVGRWRGRLLNIHPSLLPAFKGAHAIKDAIDAGVCVTGCTVHFVEESVDAGCIIGQESVQVMPGDTEETLLKRMHKAEHVVYPRSLLLLASGKIKFDKDSNKLIRS